MERGRKIMARGLPAEITEEEALGVALILRERLVDTTRPRRAAEAAEMAESMLERAISADLKKIDVACHKGCGFCCTSRVIVSAPEIFRVAHWLGANATVPGAPVQMSAVLAEAARRAGLPLDQRINLREPCPVLVDGACGVYEVRPISCRAVHSLSSQACRVAMVDDAAEMPLVIPTFSKGDTARSLLLAAVSAAGLSDHGIEYTGGLEAAIKTPDAEARWLAGDNIFADVLGAARKPDARQLQDHLAARVRELVA